MAIIVHTIHVFIQNPLYGSTVHPPTDKNSTFLVFFNFHSGFHCLITGIMLLFFLDLISHNTTKSEIIHHNLYILAGYQKNQCDVKENKKDDSNSIFMCLSFLLVSDQMPCRNELINRVSFENESLKSHVCSFKITGNH